ncbi:LysE family translocator [Thalassospira alkalitolerans]|uniref:LysE family translocator n=1 Tax=Thalassospira alkalitolerans TaxID=1293890 RepID=UPI003AA87DE1
MISEQFGLYFLAVIIAVFTPGPAVMLGITNSIRHGMAAAIIGALGYVTGTGLMGGLSAMGLGALIMTSGLLFTIVHYVGAGYLIWLGIRMWRNSRKADLPTAEPSGTGKEAFRPLRLYVRGFLVSASNPKAIAFFTALFPLFIDQNAPLAGQFIVLDGTFVVMSFSSIVIYALLAARSRAFLIGTGRKWFDRISGGIFVSFGIALWASGR